MSCYHPLKGFVLGIKDNGKKELKLSSYETDHIEQLSDGRFLERPSSDLPILGRPFREFITIPCGRCIGCRLQYAKQWADRAVLELPYYDSSFFLTLTYNDDNLPYRESKSGITHWSLEKEDFQKFMKRLRNYTDSEDYKIRYLACGEYGDNTFRPHYHAIIFGLKIPDLKVFSKSPLGDIYYTSDIISKIWNKGHVLVAEASHQTINYVARYVTKKMYGKKAEFYEEFNLQAPFLLMSRRPGLGRQYYEDHKKELFTESKYYFSTPGGAKSACPGRYFNNLFELDFDSESVNNRKLLMKKLYQDSTNIELSNTSLDYLEYLEDKEYNKSNQTKVLKRELDRFL